ncbi:hypothetical protein BDF21DRAFT_461458 [Thamnidium elegans]|uniref:Uncharacterized protein n=1 Tax=Thamnidium elegans TaxID=101142 RepID=A0A8H7VW87_9FUNG|nr:hypothetical protein INT48_006965 [Thamnidium elegans]KAI8085545.1 hypothetical protein BDF21DRAFT_461458 [Thamnidium elegans]
MRKGQFKKSYEIFQEDSQSAYTSDIDFDVNEDMWASLCAKVVQRKDERNQNIACSDKLATTSALYKQSNDQHRDNLLATSSFHYPKRQKVSDDIDDLIPNAMIFKAGYNLLKNQYTISTAQEGASANQKPEERKSDVYVLAMDWIGVCAYNFAVKKINEVHVAHHIGDLVLPASLSSFQDFQTTLNLLFSFRNHQLKLKRIVEPAYNRQSASNTLKSFRSVTPPSISPKTSQSNIIHPLPSDDIDDTYDNF